MNQHFVIPVSPGELIDKITILEIKGEFIKDSNKLKNVKLEYKLLINILEDKITGSSNLKMLRQQLKEINMELWHIEDEIRELEKNKLFNTEFITLARSVYFTNDKRSKIKKKINELLNSDIMEEKSYSDY